MDSLVQNLTRPKPAPMPTQTRQTLLQRKCACGGNAGVDGECAECRKKRLQRRARGTGEPAANLEGVPLVVQNVLNTPGQPLDAQTRAFMEPRFGHDFSNVHVHNDAARCRLSKCGERAGIYGGTKCGVWRESICAAFEHRTKIARARIDARGPAAFRSSCRRRFAGTSCRNAKPNITRMRLERGRHFLFAERRPTIARQPQSPTQTTVEVTVAPGPNVCGLAQHRQIFPAVIQAGRWLDTAISHLDSFIWRPPRRAQQRRATH